MTPIAGLSQHTLLPTSPVTGEGVKLMVSDLQPQKSGHGMEYSEALLLIAVASQCMIVCMLKLVHTY